jgi:predicted DNA-binding transcriptional regulator AlpA
MTLREAERRQKQRRQSDPILDRETELARALDDDRVMTKKQWCQLNGFSRDTGDRLIKSGKGPKITQTSDRRIGITVRNNRLWQRSRERA